MANNTDPVQFIADLDGAKFAAKIGAAIREAANAALETNKRSAVTMSLSFDRIGNSRQVMIEHKLTFTTPTLRGKVSEDDTTETPMYVQTDGSVGLFPDTVPTNQNDLFKAGSTSTETP